MKPAFLILQLGLILFASQAFADSPTAFAALDLPALTKAKCASKLKYVDAYNEDNAKCLAALLNGVVRQAQAPEQKMSSLSHFQAIAPLEIKPGGYELIMGNIVASRRRQHLVISLRGAIAKDEFLFSQPEPSHQLGQVRLHLVDANASKIYRQLQPTLKSILRRYRNVDHIWFSGHSMGGCVALMAAFDAREYLQEQQTLSVYTFGMPRCVNAALAKDINEASWLQVFNVVNVADPIPMLPLAGDAKSGYQHTKQMIFYHVNGSNLADNHSFYLSTFINDKAHAHAVLEIK